MPHLPLTETTIKNSIDLKANGEVSRMRSHKGNMPSLPQTKYCALCPAKFTRTTHLNRHLRSHTNERAHRCNICNAEFTRSDLLTRHKRTCGDSNVNRSRRKSCQACAESKVKCNLQQPCSKCSSRGRECVFINDPEASRNRKIAKKAGKPAPSVVSSEGDFSESTTSLDSLGPSSPSSTFSFGSHGQQDNLSYLVSPPPTGQLLPGSSFGLQTSDCSSSACSSSACSSRSSPQLDYFDGRKLSNSFNMSFEALELEADYNNDYFPNTVDPFVEDGYSPCVPRVQTETDLSGWFETNRTSAVYGNSDPSLYSQSHCLPTNMDFVNNSANLNPASSGKSPFLRHTFSTIPQASQTTPSPFAHSSAQTDPTTEELNQYLFLFFSEFNHQIPLCHHPSWRMETVPPLLLSAMQACGALFAKTPTSIEYIGKVLTTSRDTLIMEYSKPTCTLKDHMNLILTVVLLQSIGLIQCRPDQRALSKVYHEILVMMIRKSGLIKLTQSWPPPEFSNPQYLENSWRDWARYETFKRALLLAYVQDCVHGVYYSGQPALTNSELDINLPADDDLWRAQTAQDWYQLQTMPSNYGIGSARILGMSLQMSLAALKEQAPAAFPYTVNPFSAFILIHSILRDVFLPPQTPRPIPTNGASDPDAVDTLTIQCALHNWHQIWSSNHEALRLEQHNPDNAFVHNASPFYWLARLAQGAKHNGSFVVRALSTKTDVEDRYRMVKAWIHQIHSSIRHGSQTSPHLTSPHAHSRHGSFSHAS
ncbi:Zinc finger protein klf1 [Psilocybe cubensis]|uniref:Zinc finger protein klf1 n=2 Tax=Psilocybe cubensis TaxID=181762 RepID=A0ACB8GZH8_PSICU|nr:Zinc finger protein klf1 [Psilocybe cubensis]KAH9480832.1 Zinc finger protein klf1 [Psilocybe cubensis]